MEIPYMLYRAVFELKRTSVSVSQTHEERHVGPLAARDSYDGLSAAMRTPVDESDFF